MKDTTLKDTLASIEKTNKLASQLKRDNPVSDIQDIDLVRYRFHKQDLESSLFIIVHPTCFSSSEKIQQLISWDYLYKLDKHFPYTDKSYCRTKCSHCNQLLDNDSAVSLINAQATKRELRHASYSAYIEEQILLGLR
jgi:hypothetical protein